MYVYMYVIGMVCGPQASLVYICLEMMIAVNSGNYRTLITDLLYLLFNRMMQLVIHLMAQSIYCVKCMMAV